jgi:ubiquinol oxidase
MIAMECNALRPSLAAPRPEAASHLRDRIGVSDVHAPWSVQGWSARNDGDRGWIHTLLEEAENERMHLMTFIHIAKPAGFERLLILLAQGVFYNFFFLLHLVSPRTAHRVTGYFEEEAVHSYTEYLAGVDNGTHANVPAPKLAIDYWKLGPDARLREVIIAVRADEAHHRDVNHRFANDPA